MAIINFIPQISFSFYILVSMGHYGDCLWRVGGQKESVTINSLFSDLLSQSVIEQQLYLFLFSSGFPSVSLTHVLLLCSVSSKKTRFPQISLLPGSEGKTIESKRSVVYRDWEWVKIINKFQDDENIFYIDVVLITWLCFSELSIYLLKRNEYYIM